MPSDGAASMFDRANEEYDRGNYRRAADMFAYLAARGDMEARFNEGNSWSCLGKLSKAARAFSDAEQAGVTGAVFNLGRTYEDMGKVKKSLAAFERAHAEGNPKGALALALALRESEPEQAWRWMEHALRAVHPDEELVIVTADLALVWRWEDTGDPSLEAAMREAATRTPEAQQALSDMRSRHDHPEA